jgi:hypothetical protein
VVPSGRASIERMAYAAIQKHPRHRVSVPVRVKPIETGRESVLELDDISLGGAYIRAQSTPKPGSLVSLWLPFAAPAVVVAEVVHVIDVAKSVEKARPPGMGVQFCALPPLAERALRAFVARLVGEDRRAQAKNAAARFVDRAHVEVSTDRTTLALLWSDGLCEGTLSAHAAQCDVRVGGRVVVAIGPLRFEADVVSCDEGDACLRFVDLNGKKLTSLTQYVDGTADTIAAVGWSPSPREERLRRVLADARRLFDGLESGDAWAALGLPDGAAEEEVRARLALLDDAFGATYDEAAPPQRARLKAASLAVAYLVRADLAEESRLFALFEGHVSAERLLEAARAGEALVRLRPTDVLLRDRVASIVLRLRSL